MCRSETRRSHRPGLARLPRHRTLGCASCYAMSPYQLCCRYHAQLHMLHSGRCKHPLPETHARVEMRVHRWSGHRSAARAVSYALPVQLPSGIRVQHRLPALALAPALDGPTRLHAGSRPQALPSPTSAPLRRRTRERLALLVAAPTSPAMHARTTGQVSFTGTCSMGGPRWRVGIVTSTDPQCSDLLAEVRGPVLTRALHAGAGVSTVPCCALGVVAGLSRHQETGGDARFS